MARPQKEGLSYFPFDVDFFSDKKIKILKARFGADGITIYLYLLCEIYRKGYYIQLDEDYYYIISDDLNMGSDKVKQVLKFLLERSMFDNTLFQSDTILTSAGIQRRFQEGVQTRAQKNPIEIKKFWLLEKNETKSYIKVTLLDDNSQNNDSNSKNNYNKSENNATKKSKVKESKVKERIIDNSLLLLYEQLGFGTVNVITAEDLNILGQEYSEEWVKEAMKEANSTGIRNLKYVKGILKNWKTKGFKAERIKNNPQIQKQGMGFNNFTAREYDYDSLEKQLLGWD